MTAPLAVGGCRESEARAPGEVIEPGPGYAYTAVLMTAHPLYETLARLEQASEQLGDDDADLMATLTLGRFQPVTLTETLAYGPDLDSLAQRQEWWGEQYRRRYGIAEGLPRDLWAGLEWERRYMPYSR